MIKADINKNNFKNQNNFAKSVLTLLYSPAIIRRSDCFYVEAGSEILQNNRQRKSKRIKEVIP